VEEICETDPQWAVDDGNLKMMREFGLSLWKKLKVESRLGMDRTNRELYHFEGLLSSAPGEVYRIRERHEKLSEYFQNFRATGG
jgi:hypothetical protein